MAQRTPPSVKCDCATGGTCSSSFCPRVGVKAAREARLPAGSPGAVAAERIAQRLDGRS